MTLKNLYFVAKCPKLFYLLAHDNKNDILMLITYWVLYVVCSFLNKTSHWFKYVCIKMLTCKISARFHRLTEMSPDRNGSDRIGQTKKSRTPAYPCLSTWLLPITHLFVAATRLSANYHQKQ